MARNISRATTGLPLAWVRAPATATAFVVAVVSVATPPRAPLDWPAPLGAFPALNAHLVDTHRVVGMFRDPRSRAIALYRSVLPRWPRAEAPTFAAFAARIVGSVTRMLAGQAAGDTCDFPRECAPRALPDVDRALAQLRRFAFVGIAERWRRSACLLHALLGGACRAHEAQGDRAEQFISRHQRRVNYSLPRNYDRFDTIVYYHAKQRFVDDLAERPDRCVCPR